MPRLPIYLLALVCTSGTAAAQFARYPRPQPAVPAPVLSERVTPATPKPGDRAATSPSIDADAVLSIEGLRGPIRSEQEQILATLIADTADSSVEEKSDYYFRLGELYAKQFRYWRTKSLELAAIASDASKTQSAQAASKAKDYLLKTVKTFKGLTDNDAFRNYPKFDIALFYYAYTLQGGKYMKEARAVYDKLLKNYPNSKYVPEAHLAFGDYYFDSGQLADAEARYKMVLKFPKSTVYAYGLYKLGWVHVRLQRAEEAVEAFYQVVAATRGDSKQGHLNRAARADFVQAYAGTGKAERAVDPFQKLDKSAALDLAELLGDVALESGSLDRAVASYRDLLGRAGSDARACRWQYRLAHAMLTMPGATTAAKLKEIAALVRIYTSQKVQDDDCRANAAAMSSELALAYYSEWSKTQNLDALGYAEELYASYVGAFPDDATRRAQYAEVLWARADRETNAKRRSELWQRSAEMFATSKTPEAARATALAWMNALDVVVPTETKVVLGKAPRAVPRALPLKGPDAKLVAAVTAYATQPAVADDDLAQMRLAVAMILRRYHRFDDAATMFDDFIANHRDHAGSELAANLLLDSLIQARKLDEVLEVADVMTADRTFIDGKRQLAANILVLRSRSLR